jgi:prepilin-type N-terminal cleavage/methylation domain-containing protein
MIKKQKHFNHGGFTLIELLLAVSIISLLASILLASVVSARWRAYDVTRYDNQNTISKAVDLYYMDNGFYPTTTNTSLVTSDSPQWQSDFAVKLSPYIGSLPPPIGSGSVVIQLPFFFLPTTLRTGQYVYANISSKAGSGAYKQWGFTITDGAGTRFVCLKDPSYFLATYTNTSESSNNIYAYWPRGSPPDYLINVIHYEGNIEDPSTVGSCPGLVNP